MARQPGKNVDSLYEREIQSDYIVVICNGNFIRVKVYDTQTQEVLSSETIYQNILEAKRIAETNSEGKVGVFNGANRKEWYDVYEELEKYGENKKNFRVMNNAIAVLCLDSDATDNWSQFMKNLQDGGENNYNNRWYDKALQIIVDKKGRAGLNIEHAATDGALAMSLADRMAKFASNVNINSEQLTKQSIASDNVVELKWETNIPPQILDKAIDSVKNKVSEFNISSFEFNIPFKEPTEILNFKIDNFMQMAIYFTLQQLKGGEVPISQVEPVNLSAIEHRLSLEPVPVREFFTAYEEFLASLEDKNNSLLFKLFYQRANDSLRQIVKEAKSGNSAVGKLLSLVEATKRNLSFFNGVVGLDVSGYTDQSRKFLQQLDSNLANVFNPLCVASNGGGGREFVERFGTTASEADKTIAIGYTIDWKDGELKIKTNIKTSSDTNAEEVRVKLEETIKNMVRLFSQ